MHHIDLLIHNAELVTCAGPGPRRRQAMRDVGALSAAAVAIHNEHIIDIGPSHVLCSQYQAHTSIDARGMAICPGFVDPHTHVVYAGDRVAEFEQRIAGTSYMQIMAAGGGIAFTMQATRAASLAQLVAETKPRLDAMLRLGTTTAESKSGYGLSLEAELNQLEASALLDASHAIDLVPTFLGAHALPPEFRDQPDNYVNIIIESMLPAVLTWYQASHFKRVGIPLFVDVFCEQNAFNLDQSRRILTAAKQAGLPIKAHVDEFTALGGLAMALELGAVSVDHLDVSRPEEIALLAQSESIAVVIPTVTFHLGGHDYANARGIIDAGGALALTTDINPGSSPCPSMPFAMAIACRYQKLLPSEALIAATLNAAHAIGLGSRIGSIEVGKQADLLILNTHDYRHLAYQFGGNLVAMVIKRGKLLQE